jgi:hypothetical protein
MPTKQFKRTRMIRKLRTYLRVICDIGRKIEGGHNSQRQPIQPEALVIARAYLKLGRDIPGFPTTKE